MPFQTPNERASSTPGRRARTPGLVVLASLVALALPAGDALAAAPVGLGTAEGFAVLASTTVTNTGPSLVSGSLGLSPGPLTAVTGFPPGQVVNGTIHAADAVAGQARADLTTAYLNAEAQAKTATVTADLGGQTLTPGVYSSASTLGLTGQLTLNAQGDPSAVFIFQAGSTLTTASASSVSLVNGAQSCNVFWQVGSSATLGTYSVFRGSILALTAITVTTGATLDGRALARNAAVTLDSDTIAAAHCASGGGAPPASTPLATPPLGGQPAGGPLATPPGGAPGARSGTAVLTTGTDTITSTGPRRCEQGTRRALVTGRFIRRVVFSVGGRVIASAGRSPFEARVAADAATRVVSARVTFTDGTPAATLRLRLRPCGTATRRAHARQRSPSRPPRAPRGFTG